MQTPRTGATASAPEHDSSTAQLDGGESERRATTPPAGAEEPAPAPGSRPGSVPGTEISAGTEISPGAEAASRAPSAGGRTVALAVAGLTVAVLLLSGLSLSIGAGEVGVGGVLDYLLNRDGARDNARLSLVVGDLRLPRTLTALLVGAALGVAGCLLQAVTRNPLAETGLLGVNAGASLGVVAGIALLGFDSGYAYLVCAFVGAVVASGLVLLISGRRGGGSPMRLVLAGAALGATFGGLTSVIVVNSAETYDRFRFWVLGSLAGVEGFGELGRLAPVLAIGFLVALLVARPLSALALGDDLARSLGHRPPVIRTVVAVGVTLLTASAVALAGPISFLGLLAGFLARAIAGTRLAARLLLAGLIGACVLAISDVAARVVSRPFEAPVSVIVALIGAPVLIAIVRSKQLASMGMTEPATEERAPDRPRRFKLTLPRPKSRTPKAVRVRPPDTLVVRRGPLSLLVTRRAALAAIALAAALLLAVVLSAYAGQSDMGVARTFRAVFGQGDRFDVLLVQNFRLGRIVAGLTAGAALGLAGCLTQTLARNRLATPNSSASTTVPPPPSCSPSPSAPPERSAPGGPARSAPWSPSSSSPRSPAASASAATASSSSASRCRHWPPPSPRSCSPAGPSAPPARSTCGPRAASTGAATPSPSPSSSASRSSSPSASPSPATSASCASTTPPPPPSAPPPAGCAPSPCCWPSASRASRSASADRSASWPSPHPSSPPGSPAPCGSRSSARC